MVRGHEFNFFHNESINVLFHAVVDFNERSILHKIELYCLVTSIYIGKYALDNICKKKFSPPDCGRMPVYNEV